MCTFDVTIHIRARENRILEGCEQTRSSGVYIVIRACVVLRNTTQPTPHIPNTDIYNYRDRSFDTYIRQLEFNPALINLTILSVKIFITSTDRSARITNKKLIDYTQREYNISFAFLMIYLNVKPIITVYATGVLR